MTTATFPTASSSTSTRPQGAPAGCSDGANPTYSANRNEGANRVQGADGAHQTIGRLARQVTPQVHRLQQPVAGATGMLDDHADQPREMTDEWMDALRSTVRENPLAAVGAALALGMLVARLSR